MYERRTIRPRYKCKKCGTETDNPEKKQTPESKQAMQREFSKLFLKRHQEEID